MTTSSYNFMNSEINKNKKRKREREKKTVGWNHIRKTPVYEFLGMNYYFGIPNGTCADFYFHNKVSPIRN